MPIGDIPRYHAARKAPDALAISFPGSFLGAGLTWRELESRSNRLARLYRSVGVGKGDKVALALSNGSIIHEAAFAIWKLGAIPTALAPQLPHNELAAVMDLMQPRLLVTESSEVGANLSVPTVRGDADASSFDASPFPSEIAPFWKIMSSGGSTGRPKLIVQDSPSSFDPETQRICSEFRLPPDDVMLNPGPLYHNAPFLFASYALFTGSTVIGMERFDAQEVLRLIETHRVSWVCLVPTMMHRIWSLPRAVRERYDLSSLKTIWHMASACPAWLKEAWINWLGAERIWERYGGTEGFGSTVISGAEWLARRGSVGRVINQTKLKIVAENGALCAPGEVGELYFLPAGGKAPSFYLGAEPRRDAEGYLSLGDLGYRDEEDYVFLVDRRTDLIVRGGANIYPSEIEAALDEHPGVASSIVIGLPCDELGARVHAIIQPKDGSRMDLASVHEFLAAHLAKYKLPETYEVVPVSLRDDAGKARRTGLRTERIEWLSQGRLFKTSSRDLANEKPFFGRG
jgi:bile acid-coenzyme A ligase